MLLAVSLAACSHKEQAPPPPEVSVVSVVQRDVPVISEWIGTLDGSVNADIRPKVEGYVLRQPYKDGQFVQAGDLLFEIDPRQFRAALEQAQGGLEQAEAQLARASQDVARFTPLVADRAISQQELDNATSAERNTRAAVASARAAVDQAALDLGWTKITSPIEGIAGIAKTQVGDLVNGQTVMTTVSTVDPIRVTYGISEREYMAFADRFNRPNYATTQQGPFLELVLDDGSVFPHKGRVVIVDRAVDVKTGTLSLVAEFANPDGLLRPGQFGRVRAAAEVVENAILVPKRAVQETQGNKSVLVVGADNVVTLRTISPGESVGDLLVVRDGVKPGERVIVDGLQKARPGSPVKPSVAGTTPPAATAETKAPQKPSEAKPAKKAGGK